jgi:hypothetical protein
MPISRSDDPIDAFDVALPPIAARQRHGFLIDVGAVGLKPAINGS